MDERSFHDYWEGTHGDVARQVAGYRRYVQSHRLRLDGLDGLSSPHDGSAELWFADEAAAAAVGEDPYYREVVVPDEARFIGFGRLTFRLIVDEEVIFEAEGWGRSPAAVKLVQGLRRPADLSLECFQAGFGDAAERRLTDALGATRHVLNRSRPESYGEYVPYDGSYFAWLSDDPFDLVREVWWPDAERLAAAIAAAPGAWRQLLDGGASDAGRSTAFAARELVVTDTTTTSPTKENR